MGGSANPARPALGPPSIRLAPLCGTHEDMFFAGAGADVAMALLRVLARAGDGAPAALDSLTVTEADRLMLRLYLAIYGAAAECRMQCTACDEPSEFTLDLNAVAQTQDEDAQPLPEGETHWPLPGGGRIRPPRLADVWASGDQSLLSRISEGVVDAAEAEAWLDRAAPVMAFDIAGACPHCGANNEIRFDLAAFLAARLAGERPFLVRETHLLASRYGWSHGEIMALSRADRRSYAALIEAERSASLRASRRLA